MSRMTTVSGSRWRAIAIGLAGMLIGLIVWDGIDRRAADATQPMEQGSAAVDPAVAPQTLKLVSFNIHGGKGSDGKRDLSRIATLINDVDYVGLYEVRGATAFQSSNQAASLAQSCKTAWAFAATERQWGSDHFGNALLSRIPIRQVIRIPLINTRGKAFRNAILATVPVQNTPVKILSVHIDRENDRRHQLETVVDLFLSLEKPCILMGDLNTTVADPLLQRLLEHSGVHSPLHEELAERLPSQTIDWIFTRGLKTVSAKLVENSASDHPLIQAELMPEE
jgi:endonuclease/exonuclease/phosphatase family metal-dependent hydrolase